MKPMLSLSEEQHYVALVNALGSRKREPDSEGERLPRVWHVAVTNPGWERNVAKAMDQRGIDTFLPMIRFTTYRAKTSGVGEKPLLPRYVLFRLEHSGQRLDRVDGLERLIRQPDGQVATVADRIVHDLRVRAVGREFEATKFGTRFMRWLVEQGELPARAILLPQKTITRTARNRVKRVAKRQKR